MDIIPKKQIGTLVMVFIALIIHIIGFAAPYWFYYEFNETKFNAGIWNLCVALNDGISTCVSYANIPNSGSTIIIIEVFETLALLLLIAAPVVLIIKMFVKPMKTYLRFVVMGLLIAAAVCILIGAIIFGASSDPQVLQNIHFAFVLVIIAAALAFSSSIMVFFFIFP